MKSVAVARIECHFFQFTAAQVVLIGSLNAINRPFSRFAVEPRESPGSAFARIYPGNFQELVDLVGNPLKLVRRGRLKSAI